MHGLARIEIVEWLFIGTQWCRLRGCPPVTGSVPIPQISQPTVSRDISSIKNDFHRDYNLKNTKTQFAEDYFKSELTLAEIRKEFWRIVDNKKTKDVGIDPIFKATRYITVESLEFIPILEIMLRVNKLNINLYQLAYVCRTSLNR